MKKDLDPVLAQTGRPTAQTPSVHSAMSQDCPHPTSIQDFQGLSAYREGVESLLKLRSSARISNSIPAHAAILFEKFFEHAKDHVRIFCECLDAKVFGDQFVVEQAKWALANRNVRISVITQKEPEPSDFLDLLQNAPSNVTFVQAAGHAKDLPMNFAVMDDEAVRVEPNRGRCEATAVMNIPDYAAQLVKYFDRIMLMERTARSKGMPVAA
jgi:hypothetical protein